MSNVTLHVSVQAAIEAVREAGHVVIEHKDIPEIASPAAWEALCTILEKPLSFVIAYEQAETLEQFKLIMFEMAVLTGNSQLVSIEDYDKLEAENGSVD